MYVYIYIDIHIYIYGPRPANQRSTTIRQDFIRSYAVLTCWPRATYALHNRIPQYGVHYCLEYAHTIYLQYNVLLPIKYLFSSHILATIKISCAIHTCLPCTTYTLST